ncbi:hypothetical protein gpAD87_28055 [Paenibacillus sp. AD87]|nr:hypothetical protein gpAD87_28055 [Paenibacillus sp. AD87]
MVVYNCEVSGEGGIDSVEAKRSPLSPGFPLKRGDLKKPGDNSDRKNDPDSERQPKNIASMKC